MFKMSDLISWELTESLRREFEDLENYAKNQIYAFQHGENADIKLKRIGYISSDPGVIFDIENVFSFTQEEIGAWTVMFKDYGASDVQVGLDSTNRTITIFVHFEGKKEDKKSNRNVVYKLLALPSYIPGFIWAYLGLILWNPTRYQIF